MCLHPDIQREAQQVIDGVCKDQLPDFSQYNELPYVHAIVKECLRWNPSVPLGICPFTCRRVIFTIRVNHSRSTHGYGG